MNYTAQIYNSLWIILGSYISLKSISYKVWDIASGRGAGFIPFAAGVIIGLSGLYLFIKECSKVQKKKNFWEIQGAWRRILFVLIGFFAVPLFMKSLGFLIISFLVMIFLVRVIDRSKWGIAIIMALFSCASIYFVFKYLFEISLPKGILAF